MKRYIYIIGIALLLATSLSMAMLPDDNTTAGIKTAATSYNDKNVVDEVLWVVGDEPILKSEVEVTRLSMEAEGVAVPEDADCRIPEQLAVQKLFIHQAILDSIEVTESEIAQGIEQRLNYMIQNPMIGSKEKLEEFYRKSMTQIRQDMHDEYKNQLLMQRMQEQLVSDITVSPAEVRAYFRHLPADSVPMVPTTVEVQIITQQPKVRQEEINRIKDELRNFTERVTNGETSFSTLARLYSEDPGSARQGGELGYTGRGMLDPAFAAVAFNLTDAKKISKIVETEFGYHIIQLIDKRGDKINCRHILMKPRVNSDEIEQAKYRLDSIAADIRAGKFSFEEATAYLSDDKDTKNSNGLMVNSTESSRTSRFAMKDLPTEVARVIETMQVGEVSPAFQMENSRGKTVCAIVKLKSRTEAHRATITEDFQTMKDVIMEKRRQEVIHDWVVKKIKNTYVRMSPRYDNCDFEYEGWRK